eukprot:scaffold48751_cov50-Phaeocystis_antarctica.AAC.3
MFGESYAARRAAYDCPTAGGRLAKVKRVRAVHGRLSGEVSVPSLKKPPRAGPRHFIIVPMLPSCASGASQRFNNWAPRLLTVLTHSTRHMKHGQETSKHRDKHTGDGWRGTLSGRGAKVRVCLCTARPRVAVPVLCLPASGISLSLPAVGLSVAALAGEEMLGHLAGDAPVALARAALRRVRVRVRVKVGGGEGEA